MKAALALIFFACFAGSMASAPSQFVDQLIGQGQAIAQAVFGQLQSQILQLVQQAVGQLQSIVGSIGGRFDFQGIVDQIKPTITALINQALGSVLAGLSGLIGGLCHLFSLHHTLTLLFVR